MIKFPKRTMMSGSTSAMTPIIGNVSLKSARWGKKLIVFAKESSECNQIILRNTKSQMTKTDKALRSWNKEKFHKTLDKNLLETRLNGISEDKKIILHELKEVNELRKSQVPNKLTYITLENEYKRLCTKFIDLQQNEENIDYILKNQDEVDKFLEEQENFKKIKIDDLLENGYGLQNYNISPIEHGMTGFIFTYNEKLMIGFTLHSSKKTFKQLGLEIANIPVEEPLNPIKNVNIMQFMELELFKQIFDISDPFKLLFHTRYGGVLAHDMSHFAIKAGYKSIAAGTQSIKLHSVETDEGIVQIFKIKDQFIVDDDGNVRTPATIELIKHDIDVLTLSENIRTYVSNTEEDEGSKMQLTRDLMTTYFKYIKPMSFDFEEVT